MNVSVLRRLVATIDSSEKIGRYSHFASGGDTPAASLLLLGSCAMNLDSNLGPKC